MPYHGPNRLRPFFIVLFFHENMGYMKNVAPRPMLITVTLGAILLLTAAILTENLWLLAAVGLFHSVMWSCVAIASDMKPSYLLCSFSKSMITFIDVSRCVSMNL